MGYGFTHQAFQPRCELDSYDWGNNEAFLFHRPDVSWSCFVERRENLVFVWGKIDKRGITILPRLRCAPITERPEFLTEGEPGINIECKHLNAYSQQSLVLGRPLGKRIQRNGDRMNIRLRPNSLESHDDITRKYTRFAYILSLLSDRHCLVASASAPS